MNSRQTTPLVNAIQFWGFPILGALLLNGLLISFVPGLVSPISNRKPDVESISGFKMIRFKPPVPAVKKNIFPKSVPIKASKVPLKAPKIDLMIQEQLTLPLNLKTDLPTPMLMVEIPPIVEFTLPVLPQPERLVQPLPVKPQRKKASLTPAPVKAPTLEMSLKSLYTPGEIDSPLVPLVRTSPIYPRQAKRQGIQGWVDIVFIINRSGAVEDVQIIKAYPQGVFDRNAARAVSGWRFSPGTVDGKPVKIKVKQRLRFELNHE